MSFRFFRPDRRPLESPCISVCEIDAETELCIGCGRSLSEIARWSGMTDAQRKAIMAILPERLRAAGLAAPEDAGR